jgi:hypothetical protein
MQSQISFLKDEVESLRGELSQLKKGFQVGPLPPVVGAVTSLLADVTSC